MKIIFDEFEIEIKPRDEGESVLDKLRDILALLAVESLFSQLSNLAAFETPTPANAIPLELSEDDLALIENIDDFASSTEAEAPVAEFYDQLKAVYPDAIFNAQIAIKNFTLEDLLVSACAMLPEEHNPLLEHSNNTDKDIHYKTRLADLYNYIKSQTEPEE